MPSVCEGFSKVLSSSSHMFWELYIFIANGLLGIPPWRDLPTPHLTHFPPKSALLIVFPSQLMITLSSQSFRPQTLEALLSLSPCLNHQEILFVLLLNYTQNLSNSHYICCSPLFPTLSSLIFHLDYCSTFLTYSQHSQSLLVNSVQSGSSFPMTVFIQL